MKSEVHIPAGHIASLREVIEKAKNHVAQSERNEAWCKRCKSSNSGYHEKVKRQKQPEMKRIDAVYPQIHRVGKVRGS